VLSCSSGTCDAYYIIGTSVLITGTPANGNSRVDNASWTGCTPEATNSCRVLVDQDRDVGMAFIQNCSDVTAGGTSCAANVDLGTLLVGGSAITRTGNLPQPGNEEWFRIRFTPNTGVQARGGNPRIYLSTGQTGPFRIEVKNSCAEGARGCGSIATAQNATCGAGTLALSSTSSNITDWSMGDTFTTCGDGNGPTACNLLTSTGYYNHCSSTAWPSDIVFRVYRVSSSGALCDSYSVTVQR
jgi:hypothetical protein